MNQVAEIFQSIELDMIHNLTTSLSGQQWRRNAARAFYEYVERNQAIIADAGVGKAIERELTESYRKSGHKTEAQARQMLKVPSSAPMQFVINDAKLNGLIRQIQGEAVRAQSSAVRMMNDVYRTTLAQTQVELTTGLYTLDQSIDRATASFLDKGINSITYADGKRVNIASWAEMALRTGNRNATLWAQDSVAADYGIYTVLVSQYGACSDTCLPWQGRVYWDDVFTTGGAINNTEYPLLSEAIAGGLFHPNCRHIKSVYIEGISEKPMLIDRATAERNALLEEQQRNNERYIRKWKRREEGALTPEAQEEAHRKVRQWQKKQRELISKYPDILRRDYSREQTRGVA